MCITWYRFVSVSAIRLSNFGTVLICKCTLGMQIVSLSVYYLLELFRQYGIFVFLFIKAKYFFNGKSIIRSIHKIKMNVKGFIGFLIFYDENDFKS